MINWNLIRSKILSNTKKTFLSGNPAYNESEIDEGILLFRNFILYNSGIPQLNGLAKILIPALQDALISRLGDIAPLRLIADSLEPFLKKITLVVKNNNFEEIKGLTLIPIIKLIEINNALSSQLSKNDYPQLREENLNSFRAEPQYLYEICNSYLLRNKVHESPELSEVEILTSLKDILVIYIYTILFFKENIKTLPIQEFNSEISKQVLNGNENKILFDFISFGNTTTEIKSQIIDSYILHYLLENDSLKLSTLKDSTENYIGKSLNENFFKRIIDNLKQKNKIEYVDTLKTQIRLSANEKIRLDKVLQDFNENKELFLLFFKDILDCYGLSSHFDLILEQLKEFFETNFTIDIKEIYQSELTNNEYFLLEKFLKFLFGITNSDDISKKIIIDLLRLCEQSDFIVRISASKVIGKLTNPDYFQNYIRSQKRIVYLDTQLILHALCIGYTKNSRYENIYYQIVDELFSYSREHPNIELRFSRLYLSEVAYQLKLALLLIPFEEFVTTKFSTNVFYQFYNYLKFNELLELEDDSFGAFLENWLNVTEDDALHQENEHIISSNISRLLDKELGVNVITLPFYEIKESAVTILEDTIRQNSLSPKSHHILTNDALMVCHLSNSEEHESEPFFLTWDKTFIYYRKAFKENFNRLDIISWHLFNPSKFLNHMSLIDFKIDPKSITNEYLSILDDFGLHERTRTIVDNINRFLDIKNISKNQRRKYIQLTNEIFNEKEMSYGINLTDEESKGRISKTFEQIIDDINSYYYDPTSKYNIDLYRKMLLKEDYFLKTVEIIKNEIQMNIKGEIRTDFKENLNILLAEYENSMLTKHNS